MVIRANPNDPPLTSDSSTSAAPTPAPSVIVIDNNNNNTSSNNNNQSQTMQLATAQAQASVGLAQTVIDKEIVDSQLDHQEEHWVKSYWRPAMGWLYMAICFMDFIGFPAISMFLPVFFKGLGVQSTYTPWVPLTLSNGGLIHLSFAAILGVAAWTRGQEKLAKANGSN
jgi:hypothetical protein